MANSAPLFCFTPQTDILSCLTLALSTLIHGFFLSTSFTWHASLSGSFLLTYGGRFLPGTRSVMTLRFLSSSRNRFIFAQSTLSLESLSVFILFTLNVFFHFMSTHTLREPCVLLINEQRVISFHLPHAHFLLSYIYTNNFNASFLKLYCFIHVRYKRGCILHLQNIPFH